jgi:hypothetical protein
MAKRKILSSVFAGRNYTPDATDEEMDELEEQLTEDDVERLENMDPPVLEGFKGKRKAGEPPAYGLRTLAAGPDRPQGIEKDSKGEPQRKVLGEDVQQPENTPTGTKQASWTPTPVGTKAAPASTKK